MLSVSFPGSRPETVQLLFGAHGYNFGQSWWFFLMFWVLASLLCLLMFVTGCDQNGSLIAAIKKEVETN